MKSFLRFVLPLFGLLLVACVTMLALSMAGLQPAVQTVFSLALLVVVSFVLYFLPTIVGRKKRNAIAIFILNLLLGWTLLGWVGALVWACTSDRQDVVVTA